MADVISKNAAVMIMDGVESTDIANVLGPIKYDVEYVQALHKCYRSILASANLIPQDEEDTVLQGEKFVDFMKKYHVEETCFAGWTGDEFYVAFCSDKRDDDILAALWMTCEVIMRWFQREPNLNRLRQKSTPFFLSCGIHYGQITLARRRALNGEFHLKPEGIAFAHAKRAQSEARDGMYTKIFLTEEVEFNRQIIENAINASGVFVKFETEDKGVKYLKGLGKKRLYEVKWFHPPETFITRDRFDALFELFIMYPIQPGLAFQLYQSLKKLGENEKADKLAFRFKALGHIFEDETGADPSGGQTKSGT